MTARFAAFGATGCRGRQGGVGMALAFAGFLVAAAPAAGLTVEDCVRLALARSPVVRAALADAQAAAALVRSARAAYWPSLAAKGDYGVSKGFDRAVTNGGQTDALVSLGATLLDGGLRDARLAAAQASLRSATAKEMQQRADVVFAVRAAFFQAVAAESALAIQDDDIRMLRAYVALLERQEARGIVPHNDVLRAELAVQAAETARRRREPRGPRRMRSCSGAPPAACTKRPARPVVGQFASRYFVARSLRCSA